MKGINKLLQKRFKTCKIKIINYLRKKSSRGKIKHQNNNLNRQKPKNKICKLHKNNKKKQKVRKNNNQITIIRKKFKLKVTHNKMIYDTNFLNKTIFKYKLR